MALTVQGAEAAQTAGFVVIFPLVFASSVFVPVSTLPHWQFRMSWRVCPRMERCAGA